MFLSAGSNHGDQDRVTQDTLLSASVSWPQSGCGWAQHEHLSNQLFGYREWKKGKTKVHMIIQVRQDHWEAPTPTACSKQDQL